MGKKKTSDLGRSLINDAKSRNRNRGDCSSRHTSTLNDGYDWNKINLRSVTEDSHLDDFLATAELAGTEFTAEKLNIKFINPKSSIGVLSAHQKEKVRQVQQENAKFLRIPRRPAWDRTTTAEELDELERRAFLDWRRDLSTLQEVENIVLTPYEKNLEFWRQLWRVVERSDVVAQIVDARNPLLFHSEDLETYVKEMGSWKRNLLIVNKADFLTEEQRKCWAKYFDSKNIQAVFYSALEESGVTEEEESGSEDESDSEIEDTLEDGAVGETSQKACQTENFAKQKDIQRDGVESTEEGANNHRLLNREELLDLFKTCHEGPKYKEGMTTIGLVGYPNVGKSSTINSLLQCKKVSVSTTPGKTKHFQTILVDPEVCLCDCPGLVMPSFVSTKGDMFIWGILPIDQIRDHVPPTNLVSSLIPRFVLEHTYGISLPKPTETEDPDRPPLAEELLNVYGLMRGFMTQRGMPDNPRAARYILKDFVKGKLLYCQSPPGTLQSDFHKYFLSSISKTAQPTKFQQRILKSTKPTVEDIDEAFFNKVNMTAHTKGVSDVMGYSKKIAVGETAGRSGEGSTTVAKPWKKHNKRNKKEKLRRVYRHLDE